MTSSKAPTTFKQARIEGREMCAKDWHGKYGFYMNFRRGVGYYASFDRTSFAVAHYEKSGALEEEYVNNHKTLR